MLGLLANALQAPWRRAAANGAVAAPAEPTHHSAEQQQQQQQHNLRHRRSSDQQQSDLEQPDAAAATGGSRKHQERHNKQVQQTKRGAGVDEAAAHKNKRPRLSPEKQRQQNGAAQSAPLADGMPAPKRRGRPRKSVPVPIASLVPSIAATAAAAAQGPAGPHLQPRASLDEDHAESRPSAPLAAALSCPVCRDVLKEPVTALECGHTMCYDCLDAAIVVGGKHNTCPVCGDLLGPSPFDHAKVRFDPALDSLVKKVFPRPLLDAALDARRTEREEGTRELRVTLSQRRGYLQKGHGVGSAPPSDDERGVNIQGSGGGGQAAAAKGTVALVLLPEEAPDMLHQEEAVTPARLLRRSTTAAAPAASPFPAVELPPLLRPYVAAPPGMTVGTLRAWLVEQLGEMQRRVSHDEPGLAQVNGQDGQQQLAGRGRRGRGQQQQQQGEQQQNSRQLRGQEQQQANGVLGQQGTITREQLEHVQLLCRGQALTNMSEPIARLQQRAHAIKGRRHSSTSAGGAEAGASTEAEPVLTLTYRLV